MLACVANREQFPRLGPAVTTLARQDGRPSARRQQAAPDPPGSVWLASISARTDSDRSRTVCLRGNDALTAGTFVDRASAQEAISGGGEDQRCEDTFQDDRSTPKLAALQYYQLSIPAPKSPSGSSPLVEKGKAVSQHRALSAISTFRPVHRPAPTAFRRELGIDFSRPIVHPHSTPGAAGPFCSAIKGGFYPTAVPTPLRVNHYDTTSSSSSPRTRIALAIT